MMRIKKCLLLVFIISDMLMLSGCWNYRELSDMAIITGIGIDRAEDGELDVTFEIIDYKTASAIQAIKTETFQSKGKTLFEATRHAIKLTGMKLYWAHAQVAVISEEVARDDIIPIIDLMIRDHEIRSDIHLIIAKDVLAKDIITTMALTMNNQSYELALMIHNSDSSGEIPKVHLYQFINAMGTDGKEPVLPSVTLMDDIDKKIVASTGSAVFKGSRLRGFISNEETMWYLFVTNEIKSGLLTMHLDPKKPKETVSFEIFRSETEMKPVFSNQSVSMSIKIKLLVKLNEIAGETNYADGKQQNELEDKASEQLKENIMALIEKMKKEFDLDIFGFGNVVYQEKPLFFEKVKSSWDQQYQNLKVELQVQVKNKSTGVFNKAIEGD